MGRSTDKKPFAAQSLSEQVRTLWGSAIGRVSLFVVPIVLIGGIVAAYILTRPEPYSHNFSQYGNYLESSEPSERNVLDSTSSTSCPRGYTHAGRNISFNTAGADWGQARENAIQEKCGGTSMRAAVCPSDSQKAGESYRYDSNEISYDRTKAMVEAENCGVELVDEHRASGFHCLSPWGRPLQRTGRPDPPAVARPLQHGDNRDQDRPASSLRFKRGDRPQGGIRPP